MQGPGIRQARQLFLTHCCEAAKWNCFHTRLWREGQRDTASPAEGEMHWQGVRESCLRGAGGPPLEQGPGSPWAERTPTMRAASPALRGQGRPSQWVEGEADGLRHRQPGASCSGLGRGNTEQVSAASAVPRPGADSRLLFSSRGPGLCACPASPGPSPAPANPMFPACEGSFHLMSVGPSLCTEHRAGCF